MTLTPDARRLAVSAYLYAFPLVFNLRQVRRFLTTGVGALGSAPVNTLAHARALAGPNDTFVSINNDTVYTTAQLDLTSGPVRLHLPDSMGRYYVMQFVDAWTDNFAYIGTRATGTGAQDVVIVPPGSTDHDVSDPGVTLIHAPTDIVSIVGRWAVAGEADLPAVHALQNQMTLTAESAGAGLPVVESQRSEALDFWEAYRVWSSAFPSAARDESLEASFAPLGLTGDQSVGDLDADTLDLLEESYQAGVAALDEILTSGSSPIVNGWQMTLHAFDYNLDYFEIGTLDEPQWKIEDSQGRIGLRAAAAKAGLWGNHGYEAVYIMTYIDDRGEQLDGSNDYTLTLSPPPPVNAFWSLTMYDLPDFYLVDNPIDRYSIGDRTPGLVSAEDGSVTITISHDEPETADERANWLPAPAGGFRPLMRMYIPRMPVLDGSYQPPAIAYTRRAPQVSRPAGTR